MRNAKKNFECCSVLIARQENAESIGKVSNCKQTVLNCLTSEILLS